MAGDMASNAAACDAWVKERLAKAEAARQAAEAAEAAARQATEQQPQPDPQG